VIVTILNMIINVRKLRLVLWAGACTLAAATIALIVLSYTMPVAGFGAFSTSQATPIVTMAQSDESTSLTRDLQRLAQLNLRRRLHDPPPPPPPSRPTVAPPPPLDFRLTGTICEPGYSQAMIQLSDGSSELKSVGDTIANAKITDIQEGRITVKYFGRAVDVKVANAEGG